MKKEGLTWIGRRTNQFRYSVNEQDQWLQPLSVYTAGEAVQRGHILSVALAMDVAGDNKVVPDGFIEDDNVVVKTRTDRHIKAVGIALETVDAGGKVHVLSFGRFSFAADVANEYAPAFSESDRGKLVFVGPVAGELTLDQDEAVLNTRNVIQVGFISNTSDSWPASGVLDIEVQFEGDGRGPLGNTQFEYPLGEPYAHTHINGNSPVKVFAIGAEVAKEVQYNLSLDRPLDPLPEEGTEGYNSWIAVYSQDQANILTFGPSSIPTSTDQESSDKLGYITQFSSSVKYSPLYSGTTPPAAWSALEISSTDMYAEGGSFLLNSILDAIQGNPVIDYLENISIIHGDPIVEVNEIGTQTRLVVSLQGNNPGGPIYIEWDSHLDRLFGKSAFAQQGAYNNAGRAIVADRRFPERANALGILLNTPERVYVEGDNGLFMRKGLLTTSYDAFEAGVEYYLGMNGDITPYTAYAQYPEVIVKVGTAKNTRQLLVDIGETQTARVAGFPLGAIKPLPAGANVAEYGFLLMDDHTEAKIDYPELYIELYAKYGNEIEVDADTFRIPTMVNNLNGNNYQIKATEFGYEPLMESSIAKRAFGIVSGNKVTDIDITQLSFVGPQGTFEEPSIDRLVPHLYVNVPLSSGNTWREVAPGFHNVGGSLYGYSWNVNKIEGSSLTEYILQMDVGNGNGLVFFEDADTPITMTGQEYRLILFKPDVFARYSEFDLDIAKMTLDAMDTSKDMPINSNAVENYIEAGVTTNALVVRNSVILGDENDDTDLVTVNASMVLNQNNGDPALTFDQSNGVINSIAPMSPLDGAENIATSETLVTAKYVDDHRGENITAAYAVHGIRQGSGNNFDADMVDGHHVGRWGVPFSGQASIPEITATSGTMEIGKILDFHVQPVQGAQHGSHDYCARMEVISDSQLNLQGYNTSVFGLGIGAVNRRYLINNNGNIEFTSQMTAGTNYTPIKASAFKTASSRKYKKDIAPFKMSALDLINMIDVVQFKYKDKAAEDALQIGFIAEDTHELLAGVNHDEMNLSSTVGVLLKAVQELTAQNQALSERIQQLESQK